MRKAEVAATAALRVNTVAKRMAVELRVQKEWRGGGGKSEGKRVWSKELLTIFL